MSEIPVPRRRSRLCAVAASAVCLSGFLFALHGSWAPPAEHRIRAGWMNSLALSPAVPPPAPIPLPAPEPLAVVIDAGHGGEDGGTSGYGLLEKEWTLKVALALAETLKSRGHVVEMVRTDDTRVLLADRPVLVNARRRLAMLSIHFNAGASEATGVETFYSWPKKPEIMARLHAAAGVNSESGPADESMALAAAVQEHVVRSTGSRDRGLKNREDLAMTSRCLCPSILIECGFLSNWSENRRVQDPDWRKKLVAGIADGFESWLRNRPENPLPDPGPPDTLISVPVSGQETETEQEH